MQLASAGAGIVKLIQSHKQGKKCEEDTKVATIDCNLKDNFENVKCICERTPRATGCPGALPGDGNSNYTSSVVTASTSSKSSDSADNNLVTGTSGGGYNYDSSSKMSGTSAAGGVGSSGAVGSAGARA